MTTRTTSARSQGAVRLRICLVSQEYPPETGGGGIGTQTYLKAQGLAARGHKIDVISASWDDQDRTYGDGDAIVHRIAEPRLRVAGYEPSTYWMAYSTAVAEKLHALTAQGRFDIVQFPEYGGEGFIFQTDTFKYRTARYVVQLHGPLGMFADHMGWPELNSTHHQIGCFMERSVIHHADCVMASSHNTARFCAERYDYPLQQIEVIHSGINTEQFAPKSSPEDGRFPKVLFVGNIVASKGIGVLIDAVLQLRGQFPAICLRAIGKGSVDYVDELKRRVDDAGATAHVDFTGLVPYAELPDHYAWCDVFAGPSEYEPGPGNIYLEAMSCARPVIACNTAGAPEVVVDRQTGLLIPPRDAAALAAAIEALASNEQLRAELGMGGRRSVEEHFSLDRYISRVEEIYLRVTGS